jgi:hypothetical protein
MNKLMNEKKGNKSEKRKKTRLKILKKRNRKIINYQNLNKQFVITHEYVILVVNTSGIP